MCLHACQATRIGCPCSRLCQLSILASLLYLLRARLFWSRRPPRPASRSFCPASWRGRQPVVFLVLAPSTIDVVDMFTKATVPCSYQCGGGIRGGNLHSSRIHVVSVGLAVKQAAKLVHDGSSASSCFAPSSVVLFDEVHKMATIPPTRGFSNVR